MNPNKFKANQRSEIVAIANRLRVGWVEVETCRDRVTISDNPTYRNLPGECQLSLIMDSIKSKICSN
ncbi:MAG: hypothetical protein RLZZ338_348 [Cyanobacteriota bacterium]|jgi:hypothetical protein